MKNRTAHSQQMTHRVCLCVWPSESKTLKITSFYAYMHLKIEVEVAFDFEVVLPALIECK